MRFMDKYRIYVSCPLAISEKCIVSLKYDNAYLQIPGFMGSIYF